jgi:membrane protease YdiL (CAAX protease family)
LRSRLQPGWQSPERGRDDHRLAEGAIDEGVKNTAVFLALQLLPFSLAWCWLMQKTNSIWGSILFHAAMDIPIVVGIFSSL